MPNLSTENINIYKQQILIRNGMAFSKNNENTVPISGGCGWERIFYIINVITAVGGALGDGRHYNSYYV